MEDRGVLLVLLFVASLCGCDTDQVSLLASPRSSVFEGGFLVLRCDPPDLAQDWSVFRNTSRQPWPRQCGDGWGKVVRNACKIGLAVSWDAGLYWCQSTEGATSNVIGVRVSSDKIMVAVPYFPVLLGQKVVLSCLTKGRAKPWEAHFYKDDLLVTSDPTPDLVIRRVSRSDQGLYRCNVSDLQSAPALLLVSNQSVTVGDGPPFNSSSSDAGSAHLHLGVRLLCHLLVFCPYCISTVLMVSLYRQRPRVEDERPGPKVKTADCEDAMGAVTTEYHF